MNFRQIVVKNFSNLSTFNKYSHWDSFNWALNLQIVITLQVLPLVLQCGDRSFFYVSRSKSSISCYHVAYFYIQRGQSKNFGVLKQLSFQTQTSVSFISFFIFCHLWRRSYKNKKILRNLCLHLARKDHATKVTKIPKTILDERNNIFAPPPVLFQIFL